MRRFCTVLLITVLLCLIFSGCEFTMELDWGYAETVPAEEAQLRDQYVATAVEWLNKNSLDGSHKEIIDLYNAHEPLAVGYAVAYLVYTIGTLIVGGALNVGAAIGGAVAVAVMILIIATIAVYNNKKMKTEYALRSAK